MDPDRIPVALISLVIVGIAGIIAGPLMGNANPLIWLVFDKIFGGFGDRLDRLHRPRADLMFRGLLLTAAALFAGGWLGKYIDNSYISMHYGGIMQALYLSVLITGGTVFYVLLQLYFAMAGSKDIKGAYYALSTSSRTNLALADNYAITRTALNYGARIFDKGLVSPVFWYLVGGFPVALIYTILAFLAARFGKHGFTKGLGSVPLAMERLLGFVPGAFAALLIMLAGGFTPTAGLFRGISSVFGVKGRASYEQGGFPLSAMAWSLGIALGGPSQDLSGSALQGGWVGPEGATTRNDHSHLKRGLYILLAAHLLFAASLGSAYLWAGKMF
ncbi:MAG: cobalamin biosynthesis protein [Alphaproteobacteria bacterium]|nr:cobalamin biosynthesis protein [Alphaproteobacteria bacterium]